MGPVQFWLEQTQEDRLQNAFHKGLAGCNNMILSNELLSTVSRFEVRDNRLYWVEKGKVEGDELAQLLVPKHYRRSLLRVTHELPMGAHLGWDKPEAWLLECYWPSIYWKVADFYGSCPECQQVAPGKLLIAPLVAMPLV